MRVTSFFVVITCSLVLAAVAEAGERVNINRHTGLFEPPVSELRKASERGDRAELARAATRLGAARLARLLTASDGKTVLAALDAAPLVDSGALLIEPALPLLASQDPVLRARAVAAVAALLAQNDPARLGEYEVAPETVFATCQALATLAAKESEQLGTRISAMQGVLDAGSPCSKQLKLDLLLASAQPEIRRAAVLAMPEDAGGTTGPLVAALKDRDARVVAAAAVRLCRLPRSRQPVLPPLHALVLANDLLIEDLVELLPCLAASTDAADQKAMSQLQEGGGAVVREAVKNLRQAR
jgi:hypothetical protein